MDQKEVINAATIAGIQKDKTIGSRIAAGCMFFVAVVLLIVIPGIFIKLLCVAGFAALGVLILKREAKRGEFKAYFIRKPLEKKYSEELPTPEDEDPDIRFNMVFDGKIVSVNERDYNEANVGDEYFVMYDAYDNRITKCYSVNKYELDPSLDIRQA